MNRLVSPSEWFLVIVIGIGLGVVAVTVPLVPQKWLTPVAVALSGSLITVIIGVQNLRLLLLAIIVLDIPFQLGTHLSWNVELALKGAYGGVSISAMTFALIVLYGLWLIESRTATQPSTRPWLATSIIPISYIAIAWLSGFVAANSTLTFYTGWLLLHVFLLYCYLLGTVRTKEEIRFLAICIALAVLLESLVMIGAFLTGRSWILAYFRIRVDPGPRVGGTVGSPNTAAAYFVMMLAPTVSIVFSRLKAIYRWLAGAAFCTGIVALILTFSRGGWIGFACSMLVFAALSWRRLLSTTSLLAFVLVGGLLLIFFQGPILARLTADDNGAAWSRVPLMQIAIRIIADHPLLGIGFNNMAVAMTNYVTPEFSGEWIYVVHNKYLLVASETGLAGLVAFVGFLFTSIRRGWNVRKSDDSLLSCLALGLTAGLIGNMIHMFFDVMQSRPDFGSLWLVAGLVAVLDFLEKERHNAAPVRKS